MQSFFPIFAICLWDQRWPLFCVLSLTRIVISKVLLHIVISLYVQKYTETPGKAPTSNVAHEILSHISISTHGGSTLISWGFGERDEITKPKRKKTKKKQYTNIQRTMCEQFSLYLSDNFRWFLEIPSIIITSNLLN